MIDDLDASLKALLNASEGPGTLPAALVSFETPERLYQPASNTINLFLYEVQENRDLRDPQPIIEPSGTPGVFNRRMPPLRVDCTYLVTAWAPASLTTGAARVQAEHRLLSLALAWLSRFPLLPERFLSGTLARPPHPPISMAARASVRAESGEFWSALGIPPRPAFLLTITIDLDLRWEDSGAIVTTLASTYGQSSNPELHQMQGTTDERIEIGGVLRDGAGQPVAGAWVRLEPGGYSAITDAGGRFRLNDVPRGTGYTLRAGAPGLGTVERQPIDVPSLSGEYDLHY